MEDFEDTESDGELSESSEEEAGEILDPPLAQLFDLPDSIASRNGYYCCPVRGCHQAYYKPYTLSVHIRRDHLPKQSLQGGLRDFATPMVRVDSLMAGLDLHMDSEAGLLICDRCRHALSPRGLPAHVKTHNRMLSAVEFRAILESYMPLGPRGFVANNPFPFPPIQGVPVVERAYHCAGEGCERTYGNPSHLVRHYKQEHGWPVMAYTLGPYQAVFGKGHETVRVLAKDERLDENGDVANSGGQVVYDSDWLWDTEVVTELDTEELEF